jgi:Lon protease-like protein
MEEIGLFPLGMVLLPTEQVSLHIFEERYKELIGECLAQDREFGLVRADSAGIREIGTRAAVLRVVARFDDGRMDVVVEGHDRFKLLELTDGRMFNTGEISPVLDEDDPADTATIDRALELFRRLRDLTASDVEVPTADTTQLSYALAARVELDVEVKQALLEQTSERKRLESVCDQLVEVSAIVERQRRAAERAATNGRVDLA